MNMKLSLVIGLIGLACICNTSRATDQAFPCCRDSCGNLTVPYPFGLGNNCSLEEKFNVACDEPTRTPIPYLGTENLPITDISLCHGELQVLQTAAADCYDQTGVRTNTSITPQIQLSHSKFTVSATKTSSPLLVVTLTWFLYRDANGLRTSISGLLVPAPAEESTRFNLTNKGLQHFGVKQDLPLVLDWRIGNLSCADAKTTTKFACKANSDCVNPDAGSVGY
ncbi:Wall-associated receptor kinase, galacturonan-binding domain containing protein [Parasponia andersonii]|uniref:Wall-associated receptor kinase, galacturonan-binding domain containing protein n=1 Tax=Parasponia andersonii TaxID=3476 RepID=A0A2P5BNA8_PARAD|nr:Wall-associated receptor kinase, galacturonan-binding domain containing protein [Parasponia andersonii]